MGRFSEFSVFDGVFVVFLIVFEKFWSFLIPSAFILLFFSRLLKGKYRHPPQSCFFGSKSKKVIFFEKVLKKEVRAKTTVRNRSRPFGPFKHSGWITQKKTFGAKTTVQGHKYRFWISFLHKSENMLLF